MIHIVPKADAPDVVPRSVLDGVEIMKFDPEPEERLKAFATGVLCISAIISLIAAAVAFWGVMLVPVPR